MQRLLSPGSFTPMDKGHAERRGTGFPPGMNLSEVERRRVLGSLGDRTAEMVNRCGGLLLVGLLPMPGGSRRVMFPCFALRDVCREEGR